MRKSAENRPRKLLACALSVRRNKNERDPTGEQANAKSVFKGAPRTEVSPEAVAVPTLGGRQGRALGGGGGGMATLKTHGCQERQRGIPASTRINASAERRRENFGKRTEGDILGSIFAHPGIWCLPM